MLRIKNLIIGFFLVIISGNLYGLEPAYLNSGSQMLQTSNKTSSISADQLIHDAIPKLMKKNNISGVAVLLYENGKMHQYYFGYADPKKRIPVSENTLFELGSITKTFTGLLLAENILEKKMDFLTPLNKYGFSNFAAINLTELAAHTASLPYNLKDLSYHAASSDENKNKLNNFIQNWQAPYPPGTKMLYSNFGFGLLGIILAENAKVSLTELMQQKILDPLGMYASGLDISLAEQKNLAQGFAGDGQPVKHLSSGLFAGSWSMKVSAKDMQSYLKAALRLPGTPKLINDAMEISQMGYYSIVNHPTQLGLGWMITPLDQSSHITKLINNPQHYNFPTYTVKKTPSPCFNSNTLIEKGGGTDGFRSYIAFIPNKQIGIVILANRYFASGELPNMANKILFKITGMIPNSAL